VSGTSTEGQPPGCGVAADDDGDGDGGGGGTDEVVRSSGWTVQQ